MRQVSFRGAALAAGASLLALGAAVAQQSDAPPADDPALQDAFADPTAPGEPEPAAGDVQQPAPAPAASPAPGDPAAADPAGPGAPPASELDSLQSPATEGETPAETPAVGLRRGDSVTLRALDKITARYNDITIKIGEKKRYASLEILPRSCDKRPPTEFPETTAFLEIFDRDASRSRTDATAILAPETGKKNAKAEPPPAKPLPPAQRQAHGDVAKGAPIDPDRIFSGWMFASTPGLSALDHPVYDVWVIDCKTASAER